jgi:hypothetical protein
MQFSKQLLNPDSKLTTFIFALKIPASGFAEKSLNSNTELEAL